LGISGAKMLQNVFYVLEYLSYLWVWGWLMETQSSGSRWYFNKAGRSRYDSPPMLAGYTYDPQDAYKARDENRLLTIRLETNHTCNLRCRYCYAGSGESLSCEMEYAQLADIVTQAAAMGARSVVVIGGGEPTLYPRFRELISFINSLDMIPVVFTNAVVIDSNMAQFLYKHNASIMGKMDSLRSDVQDYLAGRSGAFEMMQRGLGNLIEAGFTRKADGRLVRLGLSFVVNRLNLDETEDIWHYCRRNNIFPNMEVITPTGRALDEMADQYITLDQVAERKLRLLDIDREYYGFDWLPFTPLAGSGCLQHMYSMYVTIRGDIRPCAPTKFDENPSLRKNGSYPHNVLGRSLKSIYDEPLFQYVRNIDRHLEGKCSGCDYLDECIGCRGYAYSVGVNEGKDPYAALRGECRLCFK
jgi:radical SAM protein with 4Fe4S-binding SPASM domain